MSKNDDVSFTSSSLRTPPFLHHQTKPSLPLFSQLAKTKLTFASFLDSLLTRPSTRTPNSPLLCAASLSLSHSSCSDPKPLPILGSASLSVSQSQLGESNQLDSVVSAQQKSGGASGVHGSGRNDEERVLISEVLVKNKDGEELERKDLEGEALAALKACRANSALTVREVQEDVHRIISSGYFSSCMPVAVDTRDGIQLVFQVEPNQEFHGLVCEGASVLPTKFIQDAFRGGYGKVVNIKHLDEVINSINGWYMERGLFGMVSNAEILSGGIIRLQVAEAEVNDISICFLDRKTGEPTKGKTKPETILRQLTTKKGQILAKLI